LHNDRTAGALRTAGLLCTDARWRRFTATLIGDIQEIGILTDADLDALAEGLLRDEAYGWPVPARWLRDGTVRLHGRRHRRGAAVVVERPIAPSLRRCAATRIVGLAPGADGQTRERS
jgi:hypothetical protein